MTRSHRITVGPLGAIIQVGLNVSLPLATLGKGGPPLTRTGLIDTGASQTTISDAAFKVLQPAVHQSASYQRPNVPPTIVPTYAIRLNFEGHLSGNPWFDLNALVVNPATPGVDVLIGMDVLSQLFFFFEGASGMMTLVY